MSKKVSMSWEKLAAMDDNGMALYGTPGAQEPYWASRPSFMYDECLATVHDFQVDGIEYSREDVGSEEIYTAQIEMPASRR